MKYDRAVVIHCSLEIAAILLCTAEILSRTEIEDQDREGFWLNFVEGGIPVFWPMLPGAENMVGKVVDK